MITAASTTVGTDTRAVVAHGAGDLRVENRPVRDLEPGEALVEIAYGGVCGSDVHYYRRGGVGDNLIKEPLTLGHEVSGRVLESREDGVFEAPPTGTRVTIHPATPCRVWPADPVTPANLAMGVAYLGSAGTNPHTQGAFADRVVVRIEQLVVVPEHLDLRRAALAEPLGVAIHAVRQAGRSPDGPLEQVLAHTSVGVIGAGPIGALVVAAARAAGATVVAASDLSGRALRVAESVGADGVADVTGLDASGAAASLVASVGLDGAANPGFDVVIESSGTLPGLATALSAVRRGGTVVGLGLLPPGEVPVAMNQMVTKEITFRGSFRFVAEIDEAVQLLADGLPVGMVLTHEFDADDAEQALRTASDPAASTKVLLRMGGAPQQQRPIVVLGLMGAGTTRVAEHISRRLQRRLRDSDADLRREQGRTGREIAERDGMGALHDLEVAHVMDALSDPGCVIAAAGSVIEDPEVRHALAEALVIWLDAPDEVLASRIEQQSHRREMADVTAELAVQRARRSAHFSAVADLFLDAMDGPSELGDKAMAWLDDRGVRRD